jgi:hypothetical protein
MIALTFSEKATTLSKSNKDPIHVFCQFFLPKTAERLKEIQQCLRFNLENPHIKTVYLLNERIYTDADMGLVDVDPSCKAKIVQCNLGRRLKFCDVFQYIDEHAVKGYNVILNSDIFLDKTIEKLQKTDLHVEKKMLALLRYEYDPTNIVKSKIFGPRHDSQDTWILHSKFNIRPEHRKVFDFEFGKPGCDNKLTYLMAILGYEVVNDPIFLKTYHIHSNQTRDYTIMDRVSDPYALVVPHGYPNEKFVHSLNVNLAELAPRTKNFSEIRFDDNRVLHDYVKGKLEKNQTFIVPRVAILENNFAMFGDICKKNDTVDPQLGEYFNKTVQSLKVNTGIRVSSIESIHLYSELYCKALQNAELIGAWEFHGPQYPHIKDSYDYLRKKYKQKKYIWNAAFDVYNYIHTLPWTLALKGKRILIVSAFAQSIYDKIPYLDKIYGMSLFPECTISTILPPQTHGQGMCREFNEELAQFCQHLDSMKDTYDVALVSCGGYSNLVCNHIYEHNGKSAICVGGVLQMYFGIFGERWIQSNKDIMSLYKNEYWTRPKDVEKPMNFQSVEGGYY